MLITIATEEGSTFNSFNVDVDPKMEMENVCALLEAEVSARTGLGTRRRCGCSWQA